MGLAMRFAISPREWHLANPSRETAAGALDTDVAGAWLDYTGRGVACAVVDDGFALGHPDLRRRFDAARSHDARDGDASPQAAADDPHGTPVAAIIGAAAGNGGTTGVSPEAELLGLRISYGEDDDVVSILASAIRAAAEHADTMNGSWSFTSPFADDFARADMAPLRDALAAAATDGRGGLGTVVVVAAGNGRWADDDVNHHNVQNSIYTIAVGAYAQDGRPAAFSTPGAALLVAAPGQDIWTADLPGEAGYSPSAYTFFSGTSAAAPIVTGVANLMLEANPHLGARDVQEILAYSAQPMPAAAGAANGADTWNGGGLLFHRSVGFGAVDATAAVRLAETWGGPGGEPATFAEMDTAAIAWCGARAIGPGSADVAFDVRAALRVDAVELRLDLAHPDLSDLKVLLVSPDGTRSLLLDRPFERADAAERPTELAFTLSSNQFWGEDSQGTWRLRVQDVDGAAPEEAAGVLRSAQLTVHGDGGGAPADDTYVYTDALAGLSGASRLVLRDLDGGVDTLNCAAVTGAVALDLAPGAVQQIAGRAVALDAHAWIENAIAGDGPDAVCGNALANVLWGGRGDDALWGGGEADVFAFGIRSGDDRILDFAAGDRVALTGGVSLVGLDGSLAVLSDGATITAANGWTWSAADFVVRETLWG